MSPPAGPQRTTRWRATPSTFGWPVKLVLTAPPFIWLVLFALQFVPLLVDGSSPGPGGAMALFLGLVVLGGATWWAGQVWQPGRELGPPAPLDPAVLRAVADPASDVLRRPPHAGLTYLHADDGTTDGAGTDDGQNPHGTRTPPTRW